MIPKYNTTRTGKTHEQLCFIVAVANSLIIAVTNFIILLSTTKFAVYLN